VTETLTLAESLDRRLKPGVVHAECDGVSAEVDVTDADRLGVSVRGVRVRTAAPGDIVDQAGRLPDAVAVLPVRVRPVEVDPTLGGAVLRSTPKRHEYFEVRTDGREATIERLRATPEGRETLPFTLTREQLGRLVDDVGGAMTGGDDEE
jgi:hypothetical protein